MDSKKIVRWGAMMGALAVALGAFGAHALKDTLETNGGMSTYKTAVLYHFIHTLLVVIVATSAYHDEKAKKYLSTLLFLGIVCFCGSLYLLSLFQWTFLGSVTPVGGLLFISAWIGAALTVKKS